MAKVLIFVIFLFLINFTLLQQFITRKSFNNIRNRRDLNQVQPNSTVNKVESRNFNMSYQETVEKIFKESKNARLKTPAEVLKILMDRRRVTVAYNTTSNREGHICVVTADDKQGEHRFDDFSFFPQHSRQCF